MCSRNRKVITDIIFKLNKSDCQLSAILSVRLNPPGSLEDKPECPPRADVSMQPEFVSLKSPKVEETEFDEVKLDARDWFGLRCEC